ncbi:MAG: UDP-N-acetylmuramyl-tripeptide synthetase [Pseudomonadales bacterium]|jgi:UDP-N-acetylmuramoyl-L-alanyl-D-glutamate--2,6-diaminopimelate ligase|nr:UDP-N-acetylmuramyl-tripeptide synthetase [Pseudomonadales bacterium]
MRELIYKLKRVWHFVRTGLLGGLVSQIRYGHPEKKLKIIAITGTDGKTTSTSIVYSLLKTAGFKVGLITTVAAYIGDEAIDTGFHVTSADAKDLYKFMDRMVKEGIEYLVLEVTSHGVYQYRTWGVKPVIAGLTNIDHEHLDYHITWENYVAAKTMVLSPAQHIVLNEDLEIFPMLKKSLPKTADIITYGKHKRFGAQIEKAIRANFHEDFNRLNAALAVTIARFFNISEKDIVKGLDNFSLPQGRMESVSNKLGINIIVDFAHTSQSIEKALKSIKKRYGKDGKIISIFGCAGSRDVQKRPKMGRSSAEIADMSIFTAEDPRHESVWTIINQMKSDLGEYHDKVISIPNRKDAIAYALQNFAQKGNTIVIFGKGHEQSMCYGDDEMPWNDVTGVKELLAEMKK